MSVLMSSTLAAVGSLVTVLVGFSRLGIESSRHLLVANFELIGQRRCPEHTAEARAARILHGLGFTKEMQAKKTKVGSDFVNL